ncbi:MAG: type II toxin-antitoxin system HicB family antitoxin [Candidatus Nitrosoglobus sp.]
MSVMVYKGYAASIEYDAGDRIFVGRLAGITDIVGFHGSTVDKLEESFRKTVDGYIKLSEKAGVKPQKPYSGKLILRMPPEVHARCAMMAQAHGKSLNQWITGVLEQEVSA